MSYLNYLLSQIKVEENTKTNRIRLEGFKCKLLVLEIHKVYGGWMSNNLFISVGWSYIEMHSFFAIELLMILERLREEPFLRFSRQHLEKIIATLQKDTWLSKVTDESDKYTLPINLHKLKRFNIDLFPNQLGFLDNYSKTVIKYNLNGMLLHADPGTGKTITALALAQVLEANYTVIISPKNAIYRVWQTDITTRFKDSPQPWISYDKKPLTGKEEFFVFHYEDLEKAIDIIPKLKGKVAIVLDECHNLNEITSVRTDSFVRLCKSIPNLATVLWQSGTPIKALGAESIPLLRAIDPLFTLDVEKTFKKVYGKNGNKANYILAQRFTTFTHRITKDDNRSYKPVETDIYVKVPNGDYFTLDKVREDMASFVKARIEFYKANMDEYISQFDYCLKLHRQTLRNEKSILLFNQYVEYVSQLRKGYDPFKMSDQVVYCNSYELKTLIPSLPTEWQKTFKNIRSIVKYVQLKVMGEALGTVLTKRRIDCFKAIALAADLEGLINNAEKKTLIFSSYVDVILLVSDRVKELGFLPLTVYQETNNQLPQIMHMFDTKADVNPLCATYKSLSTAVPVISANSIIMIDSPFRDYIYQQAISRIDRVGQDSSTYINKLLLDTGEKMNVSTRSIEIMQWSKAMVAELLGLPTDTDIDVSLEERLEYESFVPSLEEYTEMTNYYLSDSNKFNNNRTLNW